MDASSTFSCLRAKIVVDWSHVLTFRASLPDVMAPFVALRYGGETASAPGRLCDGASTLYRLFFVT